MHASVFLCAYICACDLLLMHAEGLEKSQQEGDQTYDHKTTAVHKELPGLGSHLSHKEATAGRCLQCAFLWWGTGGQRQRHVFSCTGKRVWKVPEGKDLDQIHLQVCQGDFNEQFENAKVP